MAEISSNHRVRRTPFTDGVEAAGVKQYTVYNHMLLPVIFRSMEEDYHHLKSAVQVWDVACERQVEIKGPDALKLIELLTPRNLSKLSPDRCQYIPVCDQNGGLINDPVLVQIEEDRYWVSIADSDFLLWALAVAACNGFDVEIFEPDVSPLAIQGPKSDDLASRVFGDGVRSLKFFGCGWFEFQGKKFLIARSGYSKQGGFEIYVDGTENGMPIWNALMEAGRDLDVHAGCPNLPERVEGGLLSYNGDVTRANTPLECGLGKYVSDIRLDTCFGGRALREEREAGSKRMIRPIEIMVDAMPVNDRIRSLTSNGAYAGYVASGTWSPDYKCGVAIGMVEQEFWEPGTELMFEGPDGPLPVKVRETFWT